MSDIEGPDLEAARHHQILVCAKNMPPDSICQFSGTEFCVASESWPGHYHPIDLNQPTCNCDNFPRIWYCKHIAAIHVHFPQLFPKGSNPSEILECVRASDPPQRACYDPPQFFSTTSDPLLVTLSMPKRPLPLNPSALPDLPPLPPSEPSKPSTPIDQPPVEPLVPVPWNIHRQEYSSVEMYQEPTPVENPLEDPDSPMEDAPPLEPEPFIPYEPDVPRGNTHTLSPEESPIEPWEAYLTLPSSPVSRKHSLSPTSSSSVPIRQRTSREGSYHSITPTALSPIDGTLPQSQGHQLTSPRGSADNPSSTQSSADDADNDMALNWVTINTDYLKG